MHDFLNWLRLDEGTDYTRYSVEVSYRSKKDEVLKAYAKICLGYISAGMKNANFHVKHVFDQDPIRILISSRNWDDGEWVIVVNWNSNKKMFILSYGFYNKERRSVSIQKSEDCAYDNAAEIVRLLKNKMHELKDKPDRHTVKLKKVPFKTGPKK